MKKLVFSILAVAVFFVGLGSLAEQVGAKFKSDEKALEIVRRARTAIGGDAAIAEVRSMVISGRTVNTLRGGDQERQEPGESEIALQFPDKLSQKITIGKPEAGEGAKIVSKQHDVVVVTKDGGESLELKGEPTEITTKDGNKIIVRKQADGNATFTTEGDKKFAVRMSDGGNESGTIRVVTKDGSPDHRVMVRTAAGEAGPMKHNELLRLSLALLLTAPDGLEVNYTFGGESEIDGTPVNIINAEFAGSSYKLYISRSTDLPVAMSYRGMPAPTMVRFVRSDAPGPGTAAPVERIFTRKALAEVAPVEKLVKFSDYRSTGSVQLPYKWTTSVNGAVTEVLDITSYDLNPANISDRFANEKIFIRTAKQPGQ